MVSPANKSYCDFGGEHLRTLRINSSVWRLCLSFLPFLNYYGIIFWYFSPTMPLWVRYVHRTQYTAWEEHIIINIITNLPQTSFPFFVPPKHPPSHTLLLRWAVSKCLTGQQWMCMNKLPIYLRKPFHTNRFWASSDRNAAHPDLVLRKIQKKKQEARCLCVRERDDDCTTRPAPTYRTPTIKHFLLSVDIFLVQKYIQGATLFSLLSTFRESVFFFTYPFSPEPFTVSFLGSGF